MKQINKENVSAYLEIVFTVNSLLIEANGIVTDEDARQGNILRQEMARPHLVSARTLVRRSVKTLKYARYDEVRGSILRQIELGFGETGRAYAALFKASQAAPKRKAFVRKETVVDCLGITLWLRNTLNVYYGDPPSRFRQMGIDVIKKEIQNPRVLQTRFLFNDTVEEAKGCFTPEELTKIYREIEQNFGEAGKRFAAEKRL